MLWPARPMRLLFANRGCQHWVSGYPDNSFGPIKPTASFEAVSHTRPTFAQASSGSTPHPQSPALKFALITNFLFRPTRGAYRFALLTNRNHSKSSKPAANEPLDSSSFTVDRPREFLLRHPSTDHSRHHGDRAHCPVREGFPEAASHLPELQGQGQDHQARQGWPEMVQGRRSWVPYPQDCH